MAQATMADVAAHAGVSKNTVSLALRGSPRVAEETLRRVLNSALAVNYRPDPTVAHLMAKLRKIREPHYKATIALVNGNRSRDAFATHPTIPAYVRGIRRHTDGLGYKLDEFFLHEPGLSAGRWSSIFRARNICGMLVVGLMDDNRLPEHLAPLWSEFPAVATGVRTRGPALPFASSDHHSLAFEALEKALALGYRRPALVLDGVIDTLIQGRFSAGFLSGQGRLIPLKERVPPFYEVTAARDDFTLFVRWMAEHKPDVIFTLYHEVRHWLGRLGLRVPENVGLIQYEWREDHREWAGMDQRNDLVGEAAVDMLVAMIHNGDPLPPVNLHATLIAPQWIDGATVRTTSDPAPVVAAKPARKRA